MSHIKYIHFLGNIKIHAFYVQASNILPNKKYYI